jgi:hypothetical protein
MDITQPNASTSTAQPADNAALNGPAFSDQVVAATLVTAANQTQPLDATSRGKEQAKPGLAPENVSAGSGADIEPIKELEPEVEKVAEMMEKQQITPPPQTVVRDQSATTPLPHTISQPVVVLPLSEQKLRQARNRNLQFSIRWLYTWCVRQMKKFRQQLNTLVVYREK